MLLLSADARGRARAPKILADVEARSRAAAADRAPATTGALRPLAFEINHRAEADYHLLQFAAPPALLETLSHNLHIADGVLRFRIIKVLPGTPPPPELRPSPLVAARGSGRRCRTHDGWR